MLWGILPPAKALQSKVAPGRGPHKTAVRFSGSGKRTLKTFSLQRKLYRLKLLLGVGHTKPLCVFQGPENAP